MQDVTPTPTGEPKQENTFRGLFSRMAMGQCVHAALCVAIGAAIGLSAGRVSTALGIILGILAAAAGAVVCALWFRRHVSRPVEQITEVTRTIAGGRYGTELPVQRDDELGRLATAINELSQEISRSEKMQSEFISSISHELRTPLTAITGWSETLMFDTAIQGDSRRGIAIISKEAARLTSLVEELLEFTRIQDGRFNLSMELLDIESELEDTIFTYQELLRQETPKALTNVTTRITGSVRELCTAAAAACRALGYEPVLLTDRLCCEAREAGSFLGSVVRTHAGGGRKLAYIAGGETVVHLTGKGLGGRNQELALAAAPALAGLKHCCVFSVGSDGTDGPTDAAGGYVDGETEAALRAAGRDVYRTLADNDAYHALQAVGGLIRTGATGTNVNDVAVALVE